MESRSLETSAEVLSQVPFGAFPSPASLRAYEELLEGFTGRILTLTEQETTHRQAIEQRHVEALIEDQRAARLEARRGQIFGLAIGIAAIVSGSVVAALGQPWAGGFIGCGGVTGLVTAFLIGRREEKQTQTTKNDVNLVELATEAT